MEQSARQLINRKLVTCTHGISTNESCWWCETTKNKPTEDRIDILEKRFEMMLGVLKLLIKAPHLQGSNGSVVTNIVNNIIQGTGDTLIRSGLDAEKPDSNELAFWMSTDTDTIYQRRDNSWIDISFSDPTSPDLRITDISVDDSTGALQITTP